MPVILKLDTKPSTFEPDEIEVDGKTLKVRGLTLRRLDEIQKLEADLNSGRASAITGVLKTLLEGEISPLLDLDLPKLRSLVSTLIQRAMNPPEEEKNGSGPGSESLPS
jgi:hypothetical protein